MTAHERLIRLLTKFIIDLADDLDWALLVITEAGLAENAGDARRYSEAERHLGALQRLLERVDGGV